MRITLVIYSLSMGGAQRVMSTLANHLARKGEEVTLITLEAQSRDFFPVAEPVRRIGLDASAESTWIGEALWQNCGRLKRLRAAIRASRADVVISFIDRMNVLTLVASAGLGIPVIVSERTDPRAHDIGTTWSALRRLVYRLARVLVVQCEEFRSWADRLTRHDRVCVLPNPVEPPPVGSDERGIPLPCGRMVVGMGRLGPEKGFDLLLRAFARCAAGHGDWSLVILGEGGERRSLEELAVSLGVAERVHLPGHVREPARVLRRADLFVLSSRREGWPNALAEAMASGLAVISFDCTGSREIIRDGLDGVMVRPEDVGGLAHAMDRLMSDAGQRERLGRRALEVTKRFGVDEVMKQWERLLEMVAVR